MKKKPKQLPNYDIVESIQIIPNPEVEQIKKAKEKIITVSKKEAIDNGNN